MKARNTTTPNKQVMTHLPYGDWQTIREAMYVSEASSASAFVRDAALDAAKRILNKKDGSKQRREK